MGEEKLFLKITSNIRFGYSFQNAVISLVLLSWVSEKKEASVFHRDSTYVFSKHRNLFN